MLSCCHGNRQKIIVGLHVKWKFWAHYLWEDYRNLLHSIWVCNKCVFSVYLWYHGLVSWWYNDLGFVGCLLGIMLIYLWHLNSSPCSATPVIWRLSALLIKLDIHKCMRACMRARVCVYACVCVCFYTCECMCMCCILLLYNNISISYTICVTTIMYLYCIPLIISWHEGGTGTLWWHHSISKGKLNMLKVKTSQ